LREVVRSVLRDKLFEVRAPALINPLLLIGLKAQFVVLGHEPKASALVEEIKLFVVFVGVTGKRRSLHLL